MIVVELWRKFCNVILIVVAVDSCITTKTRAKCHRGGGGGVIIVANKLNNILPTCV